MKSKIEVLRGFTLIEIIVVVAVIGLLAVVAMASFSQARANSRDKVRVSDLEQAKAAMHIYAVSNGTYHVAGAGAGGGGEGWFSHKDGGSYPKSIAEELVALGLLSSVLHDPLVPAGSSFEGDHMQYMNYFHSPEGATGGTCLFAQLENPSEEQMATMNAAPISDSWRNSLIETYSMNYASCTQ